jgi:putative Ca2+/H+ antiporter (TMEM165/GDT1 family)
VEAFLVSTAVVAVAEIGDKSQLLVLALAVHFRKPVPIILGMLAATLLNHAAAAALGTWLAVKISPRSLWWVVWLSFVGIAIWALIPDKSAPKAPATPKIGVFATTLWTFFLLEMADKTQVATVVLAAKYGSLLPVVAGTTLGIMLTDIPVVILSASAARWLPRKPLRIIVPVMFLGLGVAGLLEVVR